VSDEPTTPDPDRRDEEVAALLEVPPLDDVTRRRLVGRALAQTGGSARRAPRVTRLTAAVAAAVAVVVIGAGTALVLRDDNGGDTVAGRTPEAARGEASEGAASPARVGDLGEVSDPGVLRDRLAAFASAPVPNDEAETAAPAGEPPACLGAPEQFGGAGPAILAGTGTYDGAPAVVLVAPRGEAGVAFVLDAATCELRAEVPLV